MTTFLGERAPAAFPTFPSMFPMAPFDLTEAMRSPFAWQAPIWEFYAAAAQTSLAMWSAALSMRPLAVETAVADAQSAMMKPLEAVTPVVPTLAEVQAAALAPVEAAVAPIKAAVKAAMVATEAPARTEIAGEPEPAMVGGEAAPISPVAAVPAVAPKLKSKD